ncbi:MAG: N-acetyltransferase family protein [Candidatus Melainabacteria bacterium]
MDAVKQALRIEPAQPYDWPVLRSVVQAVVSARQTYTYNPAFTDAELRAIWMAPEKRVYKALFNGEVAGTFYIRPNYGAGPAGHIANAGFMVGISARGRGVGRLMGEFALREARRLGYEAMVFNFVVGANVAAIGLWESLGFRIIGTVPDAYDHTDGHRVPAHIMHRTLMDIPLNQPEDPQ